MAREHLYSVFKVGQDHWHIVKYDKKLMIEEGMYEVSRTGRGEWLCECPAGIKPTCRHRELVHIFTKSHKVGSNKKYDYDNLKWVED
jgi:hypothetical protein